MEREIKFRALTKNNNVMVFGDLIVCPNGEHRIIWFELKGELSLDVDYNGFNEGVQSSTIGQFTGLKDKNDVEIYEGDIVNFGNNNNVEVIFDNGCFSVFDEPLGWDFDLEFKPIKSDMKYCEVVGNIYNNPELIKK